MIFFVLADFVAYNLLPAFLMNLTVVLVLRSLGSWEVGVVGSLLGAIGIVLDGAGLAVKC